MERLIKSLKEKFKNTPISIKIYDEEGCVFCYNYKDITNFIKKWLNNINIEYYLVKENKVTFIIIKNNSENFQIEITKFKFEDE